MQDEFLVKFWGVRGSYPTPGPRTVRFGGNTACVEVRVGGHILILDAGTGIINLGLDLMRRAQEDTSGNGNAVVATILFSHMHHDHTQGFPFFDPAYCGPSRLNIFGPRIFEQDLEETLGHAMLPPSFPVRLEEMPSLKNLQNLHDTDVLVLGKQPGEAIVLNRFHDEVALSPDDVVVRTLRSYAHPSTVNIYRVEHKGKALVYATDTEGYVSVDRKLATFAKAADLLIHDAQYTQEDYLHPVRPRQGWGHSTAQMAAAVAEAARVGKLVLFHHEPRYDDSIVAGLEAEARSIFPNTVAAYEGLEINI
jgi:phosphoribosyl 1,2-cyclic phosphodiesterase